MSVSTVTAGVSVWVQAELEAARKFLYQEMGYRSRSEQLTKTSEINLDYQEVVRYTCSDRQSHVIDEPP